MLLKMIVSSEDLERMEKLERVQLATTLPGPKPICLVGTVSREGQENLAPFSSVTHLGSSPVLLGMVTRPDTVERHTLSNISATGEWTLSHVKKEFLKKAHQCSARYGREISEFRACGLSAVKLPGFSAPAVGEASVRIGLKLEEVLKIPSNGTQMLVGRVACVELVGAGVTQNGGIDLMKHGSLASTALDTYFSLSEQTTLPYAKAVKVSEWEL